MKKTLSLFVAAIMILAYTPVSAAEGDIVDIAAGNPDFSILVAALTEADLVGALQGDGPFTVFAPTNDAFTDLLTALDITAEQLLAQPDLSKVLLYHVVSGKIMSTDLSDGAMPATLNGETITVDLSSGVKISDANVTAPDIEATNGVIHVIDKVLVPSNFTLEIEEEMPSIVEIAVGNPDFSTLVAALTEADLVGALEGDGPFTVFAPTNDAFADLLAALDITAEELLAQPDLSKVLLYHVISGKIMSTDLTDGAMPATLNGEAVTVDLSSGVKINDANVTAPDIEASNGVIHVIDKVLVPSNFTLEIEEEMPSIVEIAVGNPDFSTLVAALTEADLVGALEGEGPFTVFAPTNDAFAELLEDLDITAEELLANPDLASILLYHVISGKIMSTDLTDGAMPETLNGETVTVDLSDGVAINESNVVTPDIEASNGVIHVIDAVLIPPDFELEEEDEDEEDRDDDEDEEEEDRGDDEDEEEEDRDDDEDEDEEDRDDNEDEEEDSDDDDEDENFANGIRDNPRFNRLIEFIREIRERASDEDDQRGQGWGWGRRRGSRRGWGRGR